MCRCRRGVRCPGFEKFERFRARHLADWNSIRAKTKGRADEVGERGDAVLRSHGDEVRRGALKLARIFDDDDAIRGFGDFCQQRVGQRGLAGAGAFRDEDVGARDDALAQSLGLAGGHDPGGDIVFEREYRDSGLADRESRGRNDGRQQAFKPLPCLGSSAETRGVRMDLGANMMSDQAHDAFAIGRRQALAGIG